MTLCITATLLGLLLATHLSVKFHHFHRLTGSLLLCKVQLVQRDRKESKVNRDPKGRLAQRVRPELLAQLGRKVHKENRA
jgi:hypothetical protein